jgi:predicted ribonuclease toxin of YeeF-YezG toxin-antitoxin module
MRVNSSGGSGSAGDTKTYDAESLTTAAKSHAKHYQALRDQFHTLRAAFNRIAGLGSDFQGQGADAIKRFYAGQVNVADSWLRLIDKKIAYFQSVASATDDKNLGGDTKVQIPFLNEDLSMGYARSKEMVHEQREDISKILSSISDLVLINVFSNHDVDQALDAAEKKRAKMVLDVQDLDQNLTNEYRQATEDLTYIASLYGELINATRQGADVQPMHFNAEAYHDSKIYQIQNEMKKETQNYLHYKKQQEKARQREEEKEIKDRAWKHLPIEEKIEFIKLKLKYGAGLMVMDTVTGVGYMFRHPIRTAEAFMHWNQTSAYLAQGIQDSFEKNMVHGDASTRAQWIGYASATIASFFIGTKGLDKVSKAGRAAETIGSVENVSRTVKVAKTIGKGAGQSSKIETDEISTAALQQLVNAAKEGKLPYNVINTAKLRNQLRKITQSSTGYSYDLVSRIEKQKQIGSVGKVKRSRDVTKNKVFGVSSKKNESQNSFIDLIDSVDAKPYVQYWNKIDVGMNKETLTASSQMSSSSFMNSILPKKLREHNLSYDDFTNLRLKPDYRLNDGERLIMKDIRDSVPRPNENTILIKGFQEKDIQKYLDGDYYSIKGFVSKAEDSSHIHDYSHVRESLRLDYSYYNENNDKVVVPYSEGKNRYGYIEFKPDDIEMLSTHHLEIPYGNNIKEPYSRWKYNEWPWTGNGFTASRNGEVIPEWYLNDFTELQVGAKLHRVVNGKDKVIAIFDGEIFKVIN